MKRTWLALGVIAACWLSAAGGYWFGFREALPLGLIADRLPHGVIATQQLAALRVGKTQNLATALEFYVDDGLVWGYDLFNHPLRSLFGPLWDFNVYPEYEKYATRLADYRKQHPSPMQQGVFEHKPLDNPDEEEQFRAMLEYGAQLHQFKLQTMVERYASEP